MDKNIFYVGQMFSCKEEVLCFYREFCRIHSQPFTIRNSTKKKVVFKCCRGRKRKSMCRGLRPNQHYLFNNCMAQVNVHEDKQNYWHVTKVNLEHNHEIGRVQYDRNGRKRKLNKKGNKPMSELLEAEAKDSTNADVLKKTSGKFLTRKDIQNIKNKLFSSSSEEMEADLKKLLIKVAEQSGRCMIRYNNDNTIEALFITTGVMIDCLRKVQPQVIYISISFGFEVENYKLLGFCYCSVTGKSEFAAFVFISKRTLEIIKDCLEKFKQICISDPLVFLTDRDFTGISAVRNVFPSSKILFSKFHVLKSMEKVLYSAWACHSATKENVFKMFKKVLQSQSEEEYEEKKLDLLIIANELEVSVGSKYVLFRDQFDKKWDSCKEMWVDCYRKNVPLMKDSTTDSLERSFSTLENYINRNFCGTSSVCESIVGLVDFVTKRLNNSISSMTQEVFKIINKYPKIRTLLESASLRLNETGLKLLHESLVSLEALKSAKPGNKNEVLETCHSYSTDIKSCECEFWKSNEAPCQHILLLREVLKIELRLEDCFHKRYLVTEDTEDSLELMDTMDVNICEDMGSDDEMKLSTDIEKFKKVSAVTQEINEIISAHDTETCLAYIEELKKFLKLARQGESVEVTAQSSQSYESTKEPKFLLKISRKTNMKEGQKENQAVHLQI